MSSAGPWSVKGIDPRAREVAKDLARRSGMTLGEWLNQVIIEGGEAESPPRGGESDRSDPAAAGPFGRSRGAGNGQGGGELARLTRALEAFSDRLEAAEHRSTLAINGIDRSVLSVLSRLDGVEREQGALKEVRVAQAKLAERLQRMELDEDQRMDAMKALEQALSRVADQLHEAETRMAGQIAGLAGGPDSAANPLVLDALVAQISERLEAAESRTSAAVRALETSFAALDQRLAAAETGGPGGQVAAAEHRFERLAAELSRQVEASRSELAERLDAAAGTKLERLEAALDDLGQRVQAAERKSAQAIDRMGHEVVRIAQGLGQKVEAAETRSVQAVEQMGGRVARLADAMENRLGAADQAQAEALERLGAEIGRIAERLSERIAASERRAAAAIDEVGEQVAGVTEKLGQRYERAENDLSARIRQSEERTAQLLQEARGMLGREPSAAPPPAAPAPAPVPAEPAAAPALAQRSFRPRGGFGGSMVMQVAQAAPTFPPPPPPADEPPPPRQEPVPPALEAEGFAAAAALSESAPDPAAEVVSEVVSEAVSETVSFAAEPAVEDEPLPLIEDFDAEGFSLDGLAGPLHEEPEPWEPESGEAEDGEPELQAAEIPTSAVAAARPSTPFPDDPFSDDPFDDAPDEAEDARLFEPEAPEAAVAAAPGFHDDDPGEVEERPAARPSTRELIEAARAAARAAAAADSEGGPPRPRGEEPFAPSFVTAAEPPRMLSGLLGKGRKKKESGPALRTLVLASGTAAALSMTMVGAFQIARQSAGGDKPAAPAQPIVTAAAPAAPAGGSDILAAAVNPPADGDKPAAIGAAPAAESSPAEAAPLAPPLASTSVAELQPLLSEATRRIESGDVGGLEPLKRAANLGYAPAQFYIAHLYETGAVGLKKDPAEARRWIQRAAAAGEPRAMHDLGLAYFEGTGVPKNLARAADWFRKAAEAGFGDSQYNLARLYEQGYGVPQNPAEAYKWYLIAASAGDAEARSSAERVKAQLTPAATEAVRRSAAAFRRTIAQR